MKERLIKDPSILVQDKEKSTDSKDSDSSKKRKRKDDARYSKPKNKKSKTEEEEENAEDDDDEDEELYYAERALARFSKLTRELATNSEAGKKSPGNFVVPCPIYQQPMVFSGNPYYYPQIPVYSSLPFSSLSHSSTGPFKGASKKVGCNNNSNMDHQYTNYPILPNPYLYSYNIKNQMANFDPGTVMFLVNNYEVESSANMANM